MQEYCCSEVQNAIHRFETEFGEGLNQKSEELQRVSLTRHTCIIKADTYAFVFQLMSEIQKWSREVPKIEEYRDHLRKLKKHLEEKAKESRMELEATIKSAGV